LPFKKGDILEVISKDEEEWWTARDRHGRVGQIPVKYTQKVTEATSNGLAAPRDSIPQASVSFQFLIFVKTMTKKK
jgi:proto-oncogene C-crk